MLLIEFDQNKTFGWNVGTTHKQQNQFTGCDSGAQDKLLLLTIHFPRLKIIWSPSPYATAQLFDELKVCQLNCHSCPICQLFELQQGKLEPNVEQAVTVGGVDLDAIETNYNTGIYDFVQKLPGITTKNIDRFLTGAGNMATVIARSEVNWCVSVE